MDSGLENSNQAVQTLHFTLWTAQKSQKTDNAGRPKYLISEYMLLHLRSLGFTRSKIAEMLLVSRWTLRHRIAEYGLEDITGFSATSGEELDIIVEQFVRAYMTLCGYSLVSGHLRY